MAGLVYLDEKFDFQSNGTSRDSFSFLLSLRARTRNGSPNPKIPFAALETFLDRK